MIRRHREMDADITLCSCSVTRERADQRGLVRVDPKTGAPQDNKAPLCPGPICLELRLGRG